MPWATTRDASELSRVISASTLRSAAVLLVLFEEEGETRLVLTRRSHELALHRGQLAFPGGMIEEGETPLEAALREAHEEVGLDLLTITVVGELTKVVTLPRSLIYPVVVSLPERPTLEAAPEEVAYVFDVALKDALRPEAYWEEWWPGADHAEWMEDDEHFPICFFDLGGDHVAWGPTGRILRELLCASLRIEDGRDW
jgi:8-oxo-dGTP pyrophosphatase MutT (NUDIX family)